jgi:hypothetical protein
MCTRNHSGGKGRPARKADNYTAICELVVYRMWEPRRLTTLWASTASFAVLPLLPPSGVTAPGTYVIAGRVGTRAGLNAVKKRGLSRLGNRTHVLVTRHLLTCLSVAQRYCPGSCLEGLKCGQPVSGTEFKWKFLFCVLHTDRSSCATLLQSIDVSGSHQQVKSVRKQYQPVPRNNTPRITSR